MTTVAAQAFDDTKYPDLSGQWVAVRLGVRGQPAFDPTYPTMTLEEFEPLLRQRPGEVLITFMTDYIRRFFDHPNQETKQKLQDLFGNRKVPRDERMRLCVAVAASGELFWVEGERMAEPFKLDKGTARRLKWQWQRL
jgi:hypothetical protein